MQEVKGFIDTSWRKAQLCRTRGFYPIFVNLSQLLLATKTNISSFAQELVSLWNRRTDCYLQISDVALLSCRSQVGRRDIGKNDDQPKVWPLQCSQSFDHSGHNLRGSSTDIKGLAIAALTTKRGGRSKHNKEQVNNWWMGQKLVLVRQTLTRVIGEPTCSYSSSLSLCLNIWRLFTICVCQGAVQHDGRGAWWRREGRSFVIVIYHYF